MGPQSSYGVNLTVWLSKARGKPRTVDFLLAESECRDSSSDVHTYHQRVSPTFPQPIPLCSPAEAILNEVGLLSKPALPGPRWVRMGSLAQSAF